MKERKRKASAQEGRRKGDVWDERKKRRTGERGMRKRRRRRSVQVPLEEVEKCDLVPRPGDISSTQLIDF